MTTKLLLQTVSTLHSPKFVLELKPYTDLDELKAIVHTLSVMARSHLQVTVKTENAELLIKNGISGVAFFLETGNRKIAIDNPTYEEDVAAVAHTLIELNLACLIVSL